MVIKKLVVSLHRIFKSNMSISAIIFLRYCPDGINPSLVAFGYSIPKGQPFLHRLFGSGIFSRFYCIVKSKKFSNVVCDAIGIRFCSLIQNTKIPALTFRTVNRKLMQFRRCIRFPYFEGGCNQLVVG